MLEQFDLSKIDVSLNISLNQRNLAMENNTSFVKEIKSLINKNNQKNSDS